MALERMPQNLDADRQRQGPPEAEPGQCHPELASLNRRRPLCRVACHELKEKRILNDESSYTIFLQKVPSEDVRLFCSRFHDSMMARGWKNGTCSESPSGFVRRRSGGVEIGRDGVGRAGDGEHF